MLKIECNNMDDEHFSNRTEYQEEFQDERRCISYIRDWILSIKNLKACTDDDFILRFLRCAKYDLEKTKKRILKYYIVRKNTPEWWTNRDSRSEYVKEILNLRLISDMGIHPKNGSHIFIISLDYDASRINTNDFMKVVLMGTEMLLKDTSVQMRGVTLLLDMKGLSVHHLKYFTFHFVKYVCICYLNAIPLRVKGLHYINASFVFFPLLQVVRMCLSRKLRERLRVHKDMDSLHKCIPKSCLPLEYGGTAGLFDHHAAHIQHRVEECRDYYLLDEKFGFVDDIDDSDL